MLSQYLSSIEGVALYPIISLLIFVPFFIIITVYVLRMKKKDEEEMSRIPFDEHEESTKSSQVSS